MTQVLTTESDFDSVRRAIDVTLDDGITVDADRVLPNAVIGDMMYAGLAEAEIAGWVPTAFPWPGTLTPIQETIAKNSTILLTASYVYPAIPKVVQHAFGEHRFKIEFESEETVVWRLRSQAIALISPLMELLELVPLTARTTRWRLAHASRGRWG